MKDGTSNHSIQRMATYDNWCGFVTSLIEGNCTLVVSYYGGNICYYLSMNLDFNCSKTTGKATCIQNSDDTTNKMNSDTAFNLKEFCICNNIRQKTMELLIEEDMDGRYV